MTSKTLKLVLFGILASASIIVAGCTDECDSCVADPFAKQNAQGEWVAQPTAQPDNVIVKADKQISKAVYNTPVDRVLIETIGGGNTAKLLDEFAARCARFNGTVAQKDVTTLGCYK